MTAKKKPSTTKEDAQERPFEQLVERLEKVVESLEGEELPLEKSLELFEEGVTLSRKASARLEAAERRVEGLHADGTHAPLAS